MVRRRRGAWAADARGAGGASWTSRLKLRSLLDIQLLNVHHIAKPQRLGNWKKRRNQEKSKLTSEKSGSDLGSWSPVAGSVNSSSSPCDKST